MYIIAIIEGLEVAYLQVVDRTYRQKCNKISTKVRSTSTPTQQNSGSKSA
ncbi:hypothetical protein [Microcoleus sp. Aus8_D4]